MFLGIESYGSSIVFNCLGVFHLCREGCTTAVKSDGVFSIESNALRTVVDSFVVFVRKGKNIAPIAIGAGVFRI